MRVLVTGGAGYLGSVLTSKLIDEGHFVTVVDNFMYQQSSLLDLCYSKKLQVIKGDVRDSNLIKEQIKRHDIIIPLACLVGAPLCSREPYTAKEINTQAVKTIVDSVSNLQMLIFPCTNSGYGIGEDGIHCDETSPLNPISLYGKLKVEAEQYLLDKGKGAAFRFATLFGTSPRMRLDLLVNDFVYRAVSDGQVVLFEPHFKRNYLHVRDAANAFIHTIQNYKEMQGKTFNVGISDANLSKEELCKEIQKELPKFEYFISENGKDPDKRNYIVSNKKIEETGFKTQFSLEDGVRELIKGYQVIRRNQYSNI